MLLRFEGLTKLLDCKIKWTFWHPPPRTNQLHKKKCFKLDIPTYVLNKHQRDSGRKESILCMKYSRITATLETDANLVRSQANFWKIAD